MTRKAPTVEIDWARAGQWAGRLAAPGPTAPRAELERLVVDLHDAARRARPLALKASRLTGAVEGSGRGDVEAQVLVVDRRGWARAAAQSFAGMVPPGLLPDAEGSRLVPSALTTAPASAQAASLLGALASRILGQYDPFAPGAPDGGRLLLVAPNLLHAERAMRVEPADFRLWVCVHEQTHALQFAAAPWLAGHLNDELGRLLEELAARDADALGPLVVDAVRALRPRGRSADPDESGLGPLGALLTPDQRARVDRVTAVMSVLEGHADVTMDAVGRRSIPSARRLRARLEARRRRVSGMDRVLRRLLGMDAKLAQYRRGAAFVRAVRRAGGRDALDAVWSGPESMPTAAELLEPAAWVHRVHG